MCELYPYALDRGLSPERFWALSLAEIVDTLEACEREETRQRKIKIDDNFVLASVIANQVGYIFTDKKNKAGYKLLTPAEAYPNLYSEEEKEVYAEIDPELEQLKAGRQRFAESWNRKIAKRGEENGNYTG